VLVSEAVANTSGDEHLAFHAIGAATLKGFSNPWRSSAPNPPGDPH
jgi:hypothetical protein